MQHSNLRAKTQTVAESLSSHASQGGATAGAYTTYSIRNTMALGLTRSSEGEIPLLQIALISRGELSRKSLSRGDRSHSTMGR